MHVGEGAEDGRGSGKGRSPRREARGPRPEARGPRQRTMTPIQPHKADSGSARTCVYTPWQVPKDVTVCLNT